MRRWGWRTTRNRGARCFPRREGFWTGAGSVDAGVSTTGAGLAAGFLRLPLLNCFSTTSPSTPACFRLRSPMCLICALRARNLAAAKIDDAIEEYLNDRNPRDPPPEFPATSQIDGELRELRVRFARTRYRVLYQRSQNLIVLLHAFEKNTGTVSASDRQKAERRMADFRARMEERPRRPLRARSHPGTSRASSPYVTQCGLTAREGDSHPAAADAPAHRRCAGRGAVGVLPAHRGRRGRARVRRSGINHLGPQQHNRVD